jgi:hypothetical protein
MLQVIDTDAIVRAHLLPIYGQSKVSELADVRIGKDRRYKVGELFHK